MPLSAEVNYPYRLIVNVNSTYEIPLTGNFQVIAQLKANVSTIPSGKSQIVLGDSTEEIEIINSDYMARYGYPPAFVFKKGGTYTVMAKLSGDANEGVSVDAEAYDTIEVEEVTPPTPTGEVSIELGITSPGGGGATPPPKQPSIGNTIGKINLVKNFSTSSIEILL